MNKNIASVCVLFKKASAVEKFYPEKTKPQS
jgi:hypothetical protein